MRIVRQYGWLAFLFVAGIYLLLNNLGLFAEWGDLVWGLLFAAIGLAFLVWYFVDRERWWRAIPGFVLLITGAILALGAQAIRLGNWTGTLVLLGLALGFWIVLLSGRDRWWAVIPAGILTVVAILAGVRDSLSDQAWMACLLLGLGLVFVLIYLVRFHQSDTAWAIVPAGWLLLLGVVTLVDSFQLPGPIAQWWPLLLVIGAVAGLIILLVRRPVPVAAAKPLPAGGDAAPIAPGASVTKALPEAAPPAGEPSRPAQGRSPEKPVDIYELIKQQPAAGPEPPAAGRQ